MKKIVMTDNKLTELVVLIKNYDKGTTDNAIIITELVKKTLENRPDYKKIMEE